MPYKLVPITAAPYFDTHIHSVQHGAGFMQAYSTADLYQLIDRCVAAGLTVIGVADHIPFPAAIQDPSPDQDCTISKTLYETVWSQLDQFKDYAQHKGVTLLWGGEYDVFTGQVVPNYGTDWKVLGQHFIGELNGQPWCFDLSADSFATGVKQLGVSVVVERYFALLQSALQQIHFDSVAHLDLITKYNADQGYFLEDASYQAMVLETLQVMKQTNTTLEINLGGCAATGHLVPQPWIIQQAMSLDIPVTIGSDLHAPAIINLALWQDTYQQLSALGVNYLAIPTN